jgi:hypothetical protein
VKLQRSSEVRGDVFITSAASSENAQESTRLRGSFFTSHVVSGLRGAADANSDGDVTLGELYAYAYTMTVGQTSGTRGGTQHPSYRFELRGRGELLLTRPGRATACLLFGPGPRANRWQVLDAASGAMVGEVTASTARTTRIGLRSGHYKIRRTTPGGVLEQEARLLARECQRVADWRMRRVILPETLSKGELLAATWSAAAGYRAALYLADDALPRHRLDLSLRIPLGPRWALRPRLQYGHARYAGRILAITTQLWATGLALTRDWPTRFGLIGLGPTAEALLIHQELGLLDRRWVLGASGGLEAGWSLPLPWAHLALGLRLRAGYAVYGFDDDLLHALQLQAGAGLRWWWLGS